MIVLYEKFCRFICQRINNSPLTRLVGHAAKIAFAIIDTFQGSYSTTSFQGSFAFP
jgi:hypothetical protein